MSRNFELLQRAQQDRGLGRRNGGAHLPLFEAVPVPLVASDDPITPSLRPSSTLGRIARDEIVKLVDRTFLLASDDAPRAIVFAGCEQDDSTAHVTACAAEALAERIQGRVCAVDGDLRSPALHQQFGIANAEGGVITALDQANGIARLAQHVAKNLWVVCTGTDAHGGRERRLSAELMQSLLSELRASFDYVLISAGAVASHTDAVLMGQAADGLVLLVEANKTRRETAETCKQALQSAAIRLLGAVLYNRDFPVPRALYSKL